MLNRFIYYTFFCLFFLGISLPGRTDSTLPGGVINKYTKVLSVDGADRVTVNNSADFSIGDTVLIIQMKGIEVNVPDDVNFGSRQDIHSAGKYEFIIVSNIIGNQIIFSANLDNTYDPGGAVQLIRVPGFSNNVSINGLLTADPWNTVSGTGGVVAMIVGNTLTLNADIDVSNMGFMGGVPVNDDGTCDNAGYFYDIASLKAGFKGEGAASYRAPGTVPLGTDYDKGRGSIFQGGGGGNAKHSGGGGGGNYGKGGIGGYESGDCAPFDGFAGEPGRSIKSLSFEAEKRIFLGGGGGSGTQSGGLSSTSGGDGGGIVIILANTLEGNGNFIKANGESVSVSAEAAGGGGGAGGTILLAISNYTNNVTIEAIGGDGGHATGAVCSGAGGGGGGGFFWYANSLPPAIVDTSFIEGSGGFSFNACTFLQHGFDGEVGRSVGSLQLPLTGFLFNSIYSTATGQNTEEICEGDIPAPMIGTTPQGGQPPYVFQWQSRTDVTAWGNIAGANGKDYTPSAPLLVTTYYRRVVRDSGLPVITDISKEVTILVQPRIQDNDLSAYNEDICSGDQPLEIIATPPIPTGGTGTYAYYWETSEDSGTTWTLIAAATNSSYLPPPRAPGSITPVQYRRIVSSGIGCPDTSTIANLRYLPALTNVIISDEEICSSGQPILLDSGVPVNGGSGSYTYVWEQSDDNVSYTIIPGATSETYQPPVLVNASANVVFKYYRREITSSTCSDASAPVIITILPPISGNVIGNDQSICINTVPNALTVGAISGGDGSYTYKWFTSTDDVSYNELVGETNPSYSPGNLSQPTYYKREVASKACIDLSSSPVFIDIHPVFDASIADLTAGQDIVCNGSPGKVTLTLTSPANSPWSVTLQDDQGNPLQVVNVNATPFDADVDVNYSSFSGATENAAIKYSIVTVTDQWGCPAQNISGEGQIMAVRPPVASAGVDKDVCGMDDNLGAALNFGSGIWSGPAGVSFVDATDPVTAITATAQGTYTLTWTTSNSVCPDDTDETTVNFWDAPSQARIIPNNDTTLAAFKSEVDLQAELIVPLVGQLEWSSTGSAIFNPIDGQFTIATNLNWGDNKIILSVINGSCPAETYEIKVTVLEDLNIPKGISPRSTFGQNDYFKIDNIENIDNELTIFTRSGNVVFKTENFMRADNFPMGWDGTDRRGNPLPDDTYYYVLHVKGENPQSFSGYVVIKGNQ